MRAYPQLWTVLLQVEVIADARERYVVLVGDTAASGILVADGAAYDADAGNRPNMHAYQQSATVLLLQAALAT